MYKLLIIIPFVILLAIVLIIFVKIKTKKLKSQQDISLASADDPSGLIEISIEQLPAQTELDESKLAEITDKTIISRISNTFPTIAGILSRKVQNNALGKLELYKIDIPYSKLAKSSEGNGMVRAFSQKMNDSGKKVMAKNANLDKIDPTKLNKTTAVVSGVMNVGSLVVGQYYMTEINSKLEKINENVSKVGDFQDSEFNGKTRSLISRVKKISQFSSETMENDELRKRKLYILEDLEGESTKLLDQVNVAIIKIIRKNSNLTYNDYQAKVDDLSILLEFQNALLSAIADISQLTYLFGKGKISSEMSYFLFNKYLTESIEIRNKLDQWHRSQVETLHIDLDKNRMPKTGIEGFFSAVPSWINQDWKYKELKKGLVHKINTQTKSNSKALIEPKNTYSEDIEIIIKDGNYYYNRGNHV